jgi:PGF-CTERM protein
VAFSGGAAAAANVSTEQAVAYPTDDDRTGIELALNESVANGLDGNSELEIYVDGQEVSGTTFDSVVADGSSGRVEIALDSRVTPNQNLTVKLTDFGSGAVTATDITVTSRTLTVDSAERSYSDVFGGEVIAIEDPDAGSDTEIEFAEQDESLFLLRSYEDNSHIYVYDTSDLDTGQKYDIDVGSDTTGFHLGRLDLAVEAEETNVTTQDDIVASVTTIRGGAPAEATLLDGDDDEVDSMVKELDSNDPVEFNFGNQTAADGPYTVEVTENESAITASSEEIHVTEPSNGTVSFAENAVVDERGDVAEITYELSGTDDAFVVIGDEDENNYAVEGHITDGDGDGEVTVQFNSYLAGVPNSGNASIDANDVLSASGEDEITAVRERGSFERENLTVEALDTGEYDLSATAGTTASDTPDSPGVLLLEARSTARIDSWVAPQDADLTADGVGMYDRIGTNLTRASEIADGDTVVHQLTVSGIEGVRGDRTGVTDASNTTAAFLQAAGDDGAFTFAVDRTNGPVNADDESLRLNNSNVAVVEDATNDTYFVAVELAETRYDSGTAIREADRNHELTANFALSNRADLSDDDAEVNYTITDRSAALNTSDGLVTVEADSSQAVTGTTTIAPGSAVEVRLDSGSTTRPFIHRPVATVTSNGTFTARANMTENAVGTNFTVEVSDVDGERFAADEDGRIVAAAAEDNASTVNATIAAESTTNTTTQAETNTEQPTDSDEVADTTPSDEEQTTSSTEPSPTGTTSASGPGFTAVIALLAVTATALLAVRREE